MVSGLKISNFKITTMVQGWMGGGGAGGGGSTKLYTHLRFVKKHDKYLKLGVTKNTPYPYLFPMSTNNTRDLPIREFHTHFHRVIMNIIFTNYILQ